MKIYILEESDYEGMNIKSVFSTKEKAINALPYSQYLTEEDIYEYDLDPIITGKIYEDYYYVNINPDEPERLWSGMSKISVEDFKPFKFVASTSSFRHTQGFGKTLEEATLNAKKAQAELRPVWQVWVDDKHGDDHRVRHPHISTVYTGPHLGPYAVHEDFNVAKIAVNEYMKNGTISEFLTVV